jgi:hypothetical protein
MKGIYLTEEGKRSIEAKIAELEVARREHEKVGIGMFDSIWAAETRQAIDLLREILSLAIILPVEDAWHRTYGKNNWMEYPNGVIIQPKNK